MADEAIKEAGKDANKELRSAEMKQLFVQIQDQQRRLGWNDAKLCEFATQTLVALDPYKKLKITTVDFLGRLRVVQLQALHKAISAAR